MPSPIQPSFAGGEFSPNAFGRVDLARYNTSLSTCRNFIVRVFGGVVNRPGTEIICEVKDSAKKVRLIPFAFSTSQTYALEFGDLYMRVIKDGGQVLETAKTISGTTNATPVVVTISGPPHGYVNGQTVFITGTGIAALDKRNWIVAGAGLATFQLSGSTAPGSTSAIGTAARVFELVTPYSEAIRRELKFTQLADVMTIVHGTVRPKQLSRTAHDVWTLTDFDFKEGPFQEINVDKARGVRASATTGTGVVITSSHSIFKAFNIGQLLYLEQKDFGKPWEVGKNVNLNDIRRADGRYYKARNGGNTGTLRPTHDSVGDTESDGVVTWEYMHSGFGFALVTGFTSEKEVTVTVLAQLPEAISAAPKTITNIVDNGAGLYRITATAHGFADDESIMIYGVGGTSNTANGIWKVNVIGANVFDLVGSIMVGAHVGAMGFATDAGTYKYAFGAWGGDQGWPSVVSFHQQRQVFAATPMAPQNVWMSGVNAFTFFGKSVPLVADDAVSFRIAGTQVNAIRHIVPLNQMIVLTSGGEWVISGGENDAITPSAVFARVQGYSGASDVPPVFIRDAILYLQNKGQTFRDMSYQFTSDKYDGQDLSVLASHLLEGREIVEWAYQHVPFSTVWAIRDDGVLIGLTYLREQQVLGWHRHDTDGEFESVCVVSEDNEDAVYFVIKRVINGQTKRFIERLASRLFTDIKDAFFVDCGLTYDGRNTGATAITILDNRLLDEDGDFLLDEDGEMLQEA